MRITARKSAIIFLTAFSLSACEMPIKKEHIGVAVGVLAGTVAGYELSDGNKWITALSAVAAGFVGKELGRYLDEQDEARMAQSTIKTLSTGQTSSWRNPENKTTGQTRVVSTQTKAEPVKVKVLKKKVKKVPPLDIIAKNYRAKSNSNVRGGPSTDYETVGKLAANDIVNVVGKVKGQNWLLISEEGIGSGFVYESLMELAPEALEVAGETIASNEDVAEYEIAPTQECRTVEQSVSLPDGSIHSETIKACKGATGWKAVNA